MSTVSKAERRSYARSDAVYKAIDPSVIAAHIGEVIIINLENGQYVFGVSEPVAIRIAAARWETGSKQPDMEMRKVGTKESYEKISEAVLKNFPVNMYSILMKIHEASFDMKPLTVEAVLRLFTRSESDAARHEYLASLVELGLVKFLPNPSGDRAVDIKLRDLVWSCPNLKLIIDGPEIDSHYRGI